MRKMCLLSFLLLLLTLPFLVHGSASAQTETLRVMVYDRESGFIHLYVVRGEDFLFEFKVKRS